jgi:hypothetical protein
VKVALPQHISKEETKEPEQEELGCLESKLAVAKQIVALRKEEAALKLRMVNDKQFISLLHDYNYLKVR